jgi:hypothetical protein
MCNITDNFMEDLFFDLEYQEWLRDNKQRAMAEWDYEYQMQQEAYDIMAKQYFKDLEQYEILNMEKTYKDIQEHLIQRHFEQMNISPTLMDICLATDLMTRFCQEGYTKELGDLFERFESHIDKQYKNS